MVVGIPHPCESECNKTLRWYFGGVAGCCAVLVSHPFDLLKVHLQTTTDKPRMYTAIEQTIKHKGMSGFYSGISASLLRQVTYNVTRSWTYLYIEAKYGHQMSFSEKIAACGLAGLCGGALSTPVDKVNIRMQNDARLPKHLSRNYRHVFHGLVKVYRVEGFDGLLSGILFSTSRAIITTAGQLACYTLFKEWILAQSSLNDTIRVHFGASVGAAVATTVLSMPLDVLRSRQMNALASESMGNIIRGVRRQGYLAFYRGFFPAITRITPHSIVMFLLLEQLRLRFGKQERNEFVEENLNLQ